jgi:hypothetical protein
MDVHPSITIDQMPLVSLSVFQFHQLLQHTTTMNYKLHEKYEKGCKTNSTNLQKILDSYGQMTRQEKQTSRSSHKVALSSLELKKRKEQLTQEKKIKCVEKTGER